MEDVEILKSRLEGVSVPIVLSNLVTGATIIANGGAAELLGSCPAELVGTDVVSFVHPEERGLASSGTDALANGVMDECHARGRRLLRADGSEVAVDVSAIRIDSAIGPLALWVLAPADEDVNCTCAGCSHRVVLALTDHDWQFEYVSAEAQLLGGRGEDLVGMSLLGLVHPTGAVELIEAASRAAAQRSAISVTTRLRSDNGVWTDRDCLVVPMCDHHPPRLGVVVAPLRHAATTDGHAGDTQESLARSTNYPGIADLSGRQAEILTLVINGDSVADIAAALYLSPSTVRNHLTALYRKFGVHSRGELLARLVRRSSHPIPRSPSVPSTKVVPDSSS